MGSPLVGYPIFCITFSDISSGEVEHCPGTTSVSWRKRTNGFCCNVSEGAIASFTRSCKTTLHLLGQGHLPMLSHIHEERFFQETRVPVLKIEGKCSRSRAKAAHFPGHLPPPIS